MNLNLERVVLLCLVCLFLDRQVNCTCRINSDKLKSYTRSRIERLFDVESLKSIYWPNEPLNAENLSKVSGINITLAETHFELDVSNGGNNSSRPSLLHDIFVTCSADRDRSYSLTINLELDNPFKVVEVVFKNEQSETNDNDVAKRFKSDELGYFRILLPQSAFWVQLNQRIRYDECLEVNFIQMAPNVRYDLICISCDKKQKEELDRSFTKRMAQLDAELDSILSEKLLLGLQSILTQQRLDLDLYLD